MRRKFNFKVHCPSETSDDVVLNFPPFSIIFRESGSNIVQFSLSQTTCVALCSCRGSSSTKCTKIRDMNHSDLNNFFTDLFQLVMCELQCLHNRLFSLSVGQL